MIRKLASRCLAFLTQRTGIAAAQRDVYLYGIELFLHTLFSTLGLLIISALLHRPIEGSIIIALYYTNQTIGGGFHASAHTRCFLTMSVGLVLALLLLNHQPPFIGICMIVGRCLATALSAQATPKQNLSGTQIRRVSETVATGGVR